VVLAFSLKLIWCCLLPSVCSDSDDGYSILPIQLPCLVVPNGSLGYLLKWSARTLPKRAALTGVF